MLASYASITISKKALHIVQKLRRLCVDYDFNRAPERLTIFFRQFGDLDDRNTLP